MVARPPHHLTPKQKKILDFITAFTDANGYAPSQTEIARRFRFRSLGTVQNYLVRLQQGGFITRSWNARRSVQPVQLVDDRQGESTLTVPLLGEVAAGRPLDILDILEDAAGEPLPVPLSMLGGRFTRVADVPRERFFALRVVGNSMIEDGILDGDTVVLRKQHDAENGETVVALVNGQATIKVYQRKMERGRTWIELLPANPAFQPIVVEDHEESSFQIAGVLVAVLRVVRARRFLKHASR